MTTNSKINFAIVGYGHIGKRYEKIIAQNPNSQLIGICDPLMPQTQETPVFSTLPDLITFLQALPPQEIPPVICICTPNGLHAEQSIFCLSQGFHVICEKPMALTTADAHQMMDTAHKFNRSIFCVMQNRYSPPAVWLKELINSQKLGKIVMVQVHCFWNRDDRYYIPGSWRGTESLDGGTLFTQFSHFLDLLCWLFNKPTIVSGNFANLMHQDIFSFEDTGTFQFTLPDNGIGVFNYSTAVWDQNLESSITILGSQGSVQIAGQYMNEVKVCHIKDYTMPTLAKGNPPNDYGQFKGSAANHEYVIANVIDTLSGKAEMTVKPEEGLKVIELIEEVYSIRDQQKK